MIERLYLSEDHVLLDGVHLVLELCPRRVHVGDHAANVADDGGEDEDADEEVNGHEEVFDVLHRLGGLAYKGWKWQNQDLYCAKQRTILTSIGTELCKCI